MQDTIRRILTARVYDVAEETPLDPLRRLSARLARPSRKPEISPFATKPSSGT